MCSRRKLANAAHSSTGGLSSQSHKNCPITRSHCSVVTCALSLGPRVKFVRRCIVKSFILLKLPLIICGLGACLLLSPASRAQEVNLDHFDGPNTEPFHPVNPSPVPIAKNAHLKPAGNQKALAAPSRAPKTKPASSLQFTTAQDIPQPLSGKDAVGLSHDTTAHPRKPNER